MPDPSRTASPQKRRILEAAARLFHEKGYAATSMRDLAGEVHLKASSLYNHIQSKEDLLQRICFSHARRFLEAMDEVEGRGDLAPAEKVAELVRLHIEMALSDASSVTAFNDEWKHLGEPMLSEFRSMRRDYENRFLAILREGMAKGGIRKMDPQVLLHTLLSSVRWLYDGFRPGRSPEPEELKDQMQTLLTRGFFPD